MERHSQNVAKSPRKLWVACWLAVALLLTSCVPPQAAKRIAAFSSAASGATTNTVSAFETVERGYYEAQVATLVVDYEKNGFNPNSVRSFLSPQDLAARVKVLGGLQLYAQKLSEVMGNEQLDEFDSETKGFGESLVALKGNPAFKKIAAGISDAELNIFTTAVNAIGRWLIDYKRQRDVPKIVADMHPHVKQICDLLIRDIGEVHSQGKPGYGLRDQLWIQYEQIIQAQDTFVRNNLGKLDPKTLAEEIRKLPALTIERRKADETLESTQATLRKLAETHKALEKAFDKTDLTLEQLIRELIAEGQRAKKFYESLEKE